MTEYEQSNHYLCIVKNPLHLCNMSLNRIPNYDMLLWEFYSNQQTKTFCYVSIHLRSHINNSSSCLTGISKHSKTMDKNTRAARSCFHHYFLVFGYPGETLALVVHILLLVFSAKTKMLGELFFFK